MKFSYLATLALAAAVQAGPQPDRELANEAGTFVDGAASRAKTLVDDAASSLAHIYTDARGVGTQAAGDVSEFLATRTAPLDSEIARITSQALSKVSSISERLATETDPSVRSRASAELSQITESIARATSRIANRVTESPGAGVRGPAPTAAVAMGALMGGAAMLANL